MIYVFFAEGFEEVEALAPVDVLRRAGLEVLTVGVNAKTITGAHGIAVVCDACCQEVTPSNTLEAVVLPGGMPGTLGLEQSATVQAFIDYAYANGKLIAAICAAPSILGHKGLLQGKEAIAFPSFQKDLTGARISSRYVASDGNIITARGVGVAIDFGLAITEYFLGAEKAAKLKESMQCIHS
ncbi:MAG: DJ-1/PfpI family protein [Oscillospiraceae bacterium]|jgi:4-methyl-5(b-hydroxyethyl)-thiazole monophosphate biosynthesis|nr:DJ-1/PfpI family protein [Oscillospiraceae bacterium]